ncbi:hypothetical protein ACFZCF_10825 [Streptomyces sp. NPDC007945]|uniref:hypothetical protein n=1 Tax=Streptomyces sp. NPDC007945 TaxID=3364797 RepID=UPI0036EDDC41
MTAVGVEPPRQRLRVEPAPGAGAGTVLGTGASTGTSTDTNTSAATRTRSGARPGRVRGFPVRRRLVHPPVSPFASRHASMTDLNQRM